MMTTNVRINNSNSSKIVLLHYDHLDPVHHIALTLCDSIDSIKLHPVEVSGPLTLSPLTSTFWTLMGLRRMDIIKSNNRNQAIRLLPFNWMTYPRMTSTMIPHPLLKVMQAHPIRRCTRAHPSTAATPST